MPYQSIIYDHSNSANPVEISKENIYYDNNPNVTISYGKVVKEETVNLTDSTKNIYAKYFYDIYGNLTQIEESSGNKTLLSTNYNNFLTVFKSVIKTYPKISTDTTLTETTEFDFWGRLVKNTDINGDTVKLDYTDNYGRLKKVTESINSVDTDTKKFEYYDKINGADESKYYIAKASYLNTTDTSETDKYLDMYFIKDSLGRNKQTIKESCVEGLSKYTVSGWIERDALGRATGSGIPSTIGIGDYNGTTGYIDNITNSFGSANELKTSFTYDEFGRFVNVKVPKNTDCTATRNYEANISYERKLDATFGKIINIKKVTDIDSTGASYRENKEITDMMGNTLQTLTKKDDN